MKSRLPIVILVTGLGALYVAIAIVFDAKVASAIIAGAGVAYAALNVLLGKRRDSVAASAVLARIFEVGRVTYVAIAVVWLSAISIAAIPAIGAMLREEFTITIVDENRKLVEDAAVEVRFGTATRQVMMAGGRGTVSYYPAAAPGIATIIMNHNGDITRHQHKMNGEGRYDDITIRVWNRQVEMDVKYFDATGIAIASFLRGELPEVLRAKFPHLETIQNPVFDSAQEFIRSYDPFEGGSVEYAQTETDGSRELSRVRASSDSREGRWLAPYEDSRQGLPFARNLVGHFNLDFSREILGAPVDRPLPRGFLAKIRAADVTFGTPAVADPETDEWIRSNFEDAAWGPDRSVSLAVERLVTTDDLSYLLDRATDVVSDEGSSEAVLGYMRYLVRHGMPQGLVRGVLHLNPEECGEGLTSHRIAIELPQPKLRFAILKNTGKAAIRIDQLILTVETRDGFQRAGAPVPREKARIPYGLLEPGHSLLIPTEFTIEAKYEDAEVARFLATGASRPAAFSLRPDESAIFHAQFDPSPEQGPVTGFEQRPRTLILPVNRVLFDAGEPGVEVAEGDRDRHGPAYRLGPSVAAIDYVVNGVEISARADTHTVIAWIGQYPHGSCPFVFAQYESGQPAVNLGQIIADRVGRAAKGADRMPLARGFKRIEIRELEDEISYLDGAWLLLKRGGALHRIPARNPELRSADGRYAVLRKGERLKLDFGYQPRPGDWQIELEIDGYYELVQPGSGSGLSRR